MIPARRRIVVNVNQLEGDISLSAYKPKTKSIFKPGKNLIVRSNRPYPKTEGIVVRNLKKKPDHLAVDRPKPHPDGQQLLLQNQSSPPLTPAPGLVARRGAGRAFPGRGKTPRSAFSLAPPECPGSHAHPTPRLPQQLSETVRSTDGVRCIRSGAVTRAGCQGISEVGAGCATGIAFTNLRALTPPA